MCLICRQVITKRTKLVSIATFHVIDGRCFASSADKAILDQYLIAAGKPVLPVAVFWMAPKMPHFKSRARRDCQ